MVCSCPFICRITVFLYFGAIGAGYILVEIVLIQKFILFLGHALYSAAAVICSLLFSSALGSLYSRRLTPDPFGRRTAVALCFCAILIVFAFLITPLLFRELAGLGLAAKLLVSLAVLIPLGFTMGIPFPAGIRRLESSGPSLLPWAWATNSISSVVNSAAAPLIALGGGYGLVFVAGAGCYISALLLFRFPDHGHKPDV